MLWPLTLVFLVLHTPDGSEVIVSPDQITLMRPRPDETDGPKLYVDSAQCSINMTDGKFIAVRETCEEVRSLINRMEALGGAK